MEENSKGSSGKRSIGLWIGLFKFGILYFTLFLLARRAIEAENHTLFRTFIIAITALHLLFVFTLYTTRFARFSFNQWSRNAIIGGVIFLCNGAGLFYMVCRGHFQLLETLDKLLLLVCAATFLILLFIRKRDS